MRDQFSCSQIPILTSVISAHQALNALGEIADIIQPKSTNRVEFLQECRDGKLDGVDAAYRTFHSFPITGLFDEELVNALPSSLKYLAHCGMFVSRHFCRCNVLIQLVSTRRWV